MIAQVLLAVLGLIGIATAEPDLVPRHFAFTVAAIALTFLASRLPVKFLLKLAPYFWSATLLLLVATLFLGEGGNDSPVKRWLDLGFIRFQPSELAKLGLILMLGSFFARKGVQRKLLGAIFIIGSTTLLVLLEPDLGTSVLIFSLGLVMMFAAGVRFTSISAVVIFVVLAGMPFVSGYLERNPYIVERFTGHVRTVQGEDTRQNEGYQLFAARRAMTEGGLWGLGVDAPKYRVPAGHTDMIVASIAFATGLIGVVILLLAYWLVVHSGLSAAELVVAGRQLTPELHGASVMASGAMYMIVGQAFINLGVAAGIFPVTGIPLPMVSWGGTGQFATALAFALIHAALREVRREKGGRKPATQPTLEEAASGAN
nr:FtsW/RodA/SpoVE family cell cycle protein [Deinobacterium chartae]